ncbi:MAG: DNA-binding response regulator, NarL/FixJ family [Chloroflexi bacterium]|nr:MAG: DNA-binding response regulator, NarL/FixJ family [Chloroflexota bacterium]
MFSRRTLTPREQMVAELVAQGRSNPEIAQSLGISLSTAKQNLANVMIKWNCANRTQVAVEAVRRLTAPPDGASSGGASEGGPVPAERETDRVAPRFADVG